MTPTDNPIEPEPLLSDTIKSAVCEALGVRPADLCFGSTRTYTCARYAFVHLCIATGALSRAEIADALGGVTSDAVRHAERAIRGAIRGVRPSSPTTRGPTNADIISAIERSTTRLHTRRRAAPRQQPGSP